MTNKKTTIRDVAKVAGVSIATVSYVLKGTGRVSESTIKRVWQVINDLNYSPNPYARKLFAGESAFFVRNKTLSK
ncbi:MAG: LacI family DNA-binding transcriptional regulator [Lentisphaeria bacterium]|nr:LacI family DNA-binding transcriptional regulator [Lentisphaeria bacterium]